MLSCLLLLSAAVLGSSQDLDKSPYGLPPYSGVVTMPPVFVWPSLLELLQRTWPGAVLLRRLPSTRIPAIRALDWFPLLMLLWLFLLAGCELLVKPVLFRTYQRAQREFELVNPPRRHASFANAGVYVLAGPCTDDFEGSGFDLPMWWWIAHFAAQYIVPTIGNSLGATFSLYATFLLFADSDDWTMNDVVRMHSRSLQIMIVLFCALTIRRLLLFSRMEFRSATGPIYRV